MGSLLLMSCPQAGFDPKMGCSRLPTQVAFLPLTWQKLGTVHRGCMGVWATAHWQISQAGSMITVNVRWPCDTLPASGK